MAWSSDPEHNPEAAYDSEAVIRDNLGGRRNHIQEVVVAVGYDRYDR